MGGIFIYVTYLCHLPSMSCPTKGIVSNPTISFLALRVILRSRHRRKTVGQEVIFIGSKNEHVVDVDLTYVVYEAVKNMNAHTFLEKVSRR